MKTDLRVAVVQAGAIPFDVERSVEKACRLLSDAAAKGPDAGALGKQPPAWIVRSAIQRSGSMTGRRIRGVIGLNDPGEIIPPSCGLSLSRERSREYYARGQTAKPELKFKSHPSLDERDENSFDCIESDYICEYSAGTTKRLVMPHRISLSEYSGMDLRRFQSG